jgi:hypothetical protein
LRMYLIPTATAIITAIVAAEAIKDLLNAVFGSSPFSPKYSINGKLIMGQISMAVVRPLLAAVKLSWFILNFLYAPFMLFMALLYE